MSKSKLACTRREILRNIAMSVTLGAMPLQAAQHVHQQAVQQKKKAAGIYKSTLFNVHEFETLKRLTELIIPADEVSGSALQAGAPEFIDLISTHNVEIGHIMLGGLAWLDRYSNQKYNADFIAATPEQQTGTLDLIAFRKNAQGDLRTAVRFFDWARRLTADAFYTSPVGVKDLGYVGNKGMTTFQVPVAAIQYALKRSGL